MKHTALEVFFSYTKTFIDVDEALQKRIDVACEFRTLEKKDQLLKDDQPCHYIYFLSKGILRTFHYQNGKDITYWVYKQSSMFTSWHSYLNNQIANEYIEAIEPVEVLLFEKKKFESLLNDFPAFETFWRKIVEANLSFLDVFYRGFYFMSAKEKYDLLIHHFPDITQNINLGYIASLLGISQETLSRIRAKK